MRDPVSTLVGWLDNMRADGVQVKYDGFGGVTIYTEPDVPVITERGNDWADAHVRAHARWQCHLRHLHESQQRPAA